MACARSSSCRTAPPCFERFVGGEDHGTLVLVAIVDDMEEHVQHPVPRRAVNPRRLFPRRDYAGMGRISGIGRAEFPEPTVRDLLTLLLIDVLFDHLVGD